MTAHNNNAGVLYNEHRQQQHHRKSSTKSMVAIDGNNHRQHSNDVDDNMNDNSGHVARNPRPNLGSHNRQSRRATNQFIDNNSSSSSSNNNKLNLQTKQQQQPNIKLSTISNENKNHTNIPGPITTMNLRNRTLKIAATATTTTIDSKTPTVTEQQPSSNISTLATCPQTALPTISDTIINNNRNDNETKRRRSNRRQNNNSNKQSIDSASIRSDLQQQQQQQQTSLPVSSSSSLNSSRSIRSFFPLRTIGAVCELFRSQLYPGQCNDNDDDSNLTNNHHQSSNRNEPDLALLSIVLGIIETSLTRGLYDSESSSTSINNEHSMTTTLSQSSDQQRPSMTDDDRQDSTTMNNGSYSPAEASIVPIVSNIIHTPLDIPIPTVYYENVENLLRKFQQHIKESIDLDKFATDIESIKPNNDSSNDGSNQDNTDRTNNLRELIKKISELIWSNLHRSHYKDRAHLQTIYSYVSENKLDCYGVAYTVLAACQILGLDDVRLVMSEDHAWVTFGQGKL
ncbi:hypothetical protein BLA29_002877, partial [Euroglyphus maynei]